MYISAPYYRSRMLFGMNDNWENGACSSRNSSTQGLKERPRGRYTIWPLCSSRQHGHHGPCPKSNQRAAEEGIELAELAIGFPRGILDSTSNSIWVWFDWRAMKPNYTKLFKLFGRLTDWAADFGSR
jgi:hypothetical protein